MWTDFFKKKSGVLLAFITAALFTIGALFYAWEIFRVEKAAVYKRFYFLVQESASVEASAQFIQNDGGAGYLLEADGKQYAVIAVYLNETDGETVANALHNEEMRLLALGKDYLYFKGAQNKKNKSLLVGAFECLYNSISVLNEEIARLDDGATQQSTKRILRILEKQFAFLSKQYGSAFLQYAIACDGFAAKLKDLQSEVVYAKDLRYLACELCVSYLHLAEDYSL